MVMNNASTHKMHKAINPVVRKLLTHLVLIVFCGIFIFPFIWMLLTSLKGQTEIYQTPPTILPKDVAWSNYVDIFTKIPYIKYTLNTLFIAVTCVVGTTVSSSMVAYSLSKVKWGGKKYLFPIIVATMMIPYQVTMLPLYMLYMKVGFTGTYLPLILPSFFGGAYYIFLLRQFFMTIPDSLLEAATIDGAGETRIFTSIMLPLCKPAITAIAIFTFLANWSDFMGPLLYLNKESMYTISVGLQAFTQSHHVEWGLLMAASAVFTIPIVILFFFTQRYFIEGITVTGIKG